MARIGFWFDLPVEYTGGVNYVCNLLHAISQVAPSDLEMVLFAGRNTPQSILDDFSAYAQVIPLDVIDRGTPLWLLHKILYRKFGKMWVVDRIMKRYGINVLFSATGNLKGNAGHYALISWIPDLQYLHLPELFPGLDGAAKTRDLLEDSSQCDLLLFSSYDALADFRSIAPAELMTKARVLHFVSQPHRNRQAVPVGGIAHLGAKYGFEGKFFFLPNQFWSHKNHLTVFRALAILKAKGKPCQVICTGNLKDYRVAGDAHLKFLLSFINDQELESSVKILGLIDYPDVLTLCRHAVAVLNPSRFEGWSSTVEECKSLGKQIILADIPVHREQNPPGGIFFPWDDAETLAQKLNNAWETSDGGPNLAAEAAATLELEDRTRTYGQGYLDLIQGLLLRHRPGPRKHDP